MKHSKAVRGTAVSSEVSTSVELTSARAVAARVPELVEKLTIRILSPLRAYKPEFCAVNTRVEDSQRHIRMVSCAERLRDRFEGSGVALDYALDDEGDGATAEQ